MESMLQLNEGDRASFLLSLTRSFGFSYICLWFYVSEINCLLYKDGYYYEEDGEATSSSGSSARRLFHDYTRSPILILHQQDLVPGLAFRRRSPYLELRGFDLLQRASSDLQRQFYQPYSEGARLHTSHPFIYYSDRSSCGTRIVAEAGIKMAVLMGCPEGEIEIGMSTLPQMSLEPELRKLFPTGEQTVTPSPPSPSFSATTHSLQTPLPLPFNPNPNPQDDVVFNPIFNIPFPTAESTDAALTRAYLAVLSSQHQEEPPTMMKWARGSAFKRYESGPRPMGQAQRGRRNTMMKRAMGFYRGLRGYYIRRKMQQEQEGGSSGSRTQVHHMISERRRREKINESFLALRSLLPPATKKDKASVLKTTREYLTSLKAQVAELTQQNQQLIESQPQLQPLTILHEPSHGPEAAERERLSVRITAAPLAPPELATEDRRVVDLEVSLRGGQNGNLLSDLVIRVLEFLRRVPDQVDLVSVDAQRFEGMSPANRVVFRLRIQGNEWDESAFQEAVRRVISELAR